MWKRIRKIFEKPATYAFLCLLIAVLFLFQAFIYAHQLPSRVDEGAFLIKGYYYIVGRYKPFQDYGPWTNNMPLAYYIPGLAQVLFGPGLLVGRYFAIFLSSLLLLATWLLVKRLKGKWWALASLLWFTLNPALIQIYVQAVSQVIVACLLAWMLYFLIAPHRSLLQISLSAFFCALTILTRQNMIFLLPFLILYAWLQHGKRAAVFALFFSVFPLLIVHALFFPDIMDLWTTWLPGFLRNLFPLQSAAGGGYQTWSPEVGTLTRFTSFFTAMRYYFIPLLGASLCLLLLPNKRAWNSTFERRSSGLLIILFGGMFLIHAWASLTKNYCVYCFPNYIAFFLPTALVPAVIALSNLYQFKPKLNAMYSTLLLMCMLPGAFIGSLETVGRWVMALPAPRFKGGHILPGSIEVWKLFENRFSFTFDQLLPWISVSFGLLAAVVLWFLTIFIHHSVRKRVPVFLGNLIFSVLTIVATFLMPTPLMAQPPVENTCGGDVIAAYEAAGHHMASLIAPGKSVYWAAGSVVTPLLYLPQAQIFPQQLNGIYNKRQGGDREALEKAGFYNGDSLVAWRESADFIINSNKNMGDFWSEFFSPEVFDEYEHTPALDPCDPQSFLRIYKAKH